MEYSVFREEEEKFGSEHEECSEGDDFKDGEEVELYFEEDGEDDPLGEQLFSA